MTKRENLLSLLRREGYEEVPVEFSLCPSLADKYKQETKSDLEYNEYFGFPWGFVDDMKLINHNIEKYRKFFQPPISDNSYIDLWGVGHEFSPNSLHMSYMRNPMKHMTELDELKAYPFPDYKNADNTHQKNQVESIHKKGLASVGPMQITIWETAWYLRSMEELMMDMMTDDEKAFYLFDTITDLAIIRAKSYASAGVDILFLGDDIGMQSTIMMSEELYTKWLKPRLKKIIDAAKSINPNILIFYHSCGYVVPFIEHLIEIGVDVLNPIQTESMDFKEIVSQYGNRISFHGTIGTQTTLPFGTPEEVKKAVWDNLDLVGEKGGLFVAPTHMVEPEVPWENILAYVNACKEYKIRKN